MVTPAAGNSGPHGPACPSKLAQVSKERRAAKNGTGWDKGKAMEKSDGDLREGGPSGWMEEGHRRGP